MGGGAGACDVGDGAGGGAGAEEEGAGDGECVCVGVGDADGEDDGDADDGAVAGAGPLGPASWIGIMPFGHFCGWVLVTYRALCRETQPCIWPAEFVKSLVWPLPAASP